MANVYKAGELVQLKSGGPPMTVDVVPGQTRDYIADISQGLGEYRCIWFKGATRDQGEFGEHLLQRYVPPQD